MISQKSFNQGYKSIITMVNYLIHKVKPDPEIPTPLEIVTKENVDFIEYDMKRYNKEALKKLIKKKGQNAPFFFQI